MTLYLKSFKSVFLAIAAIVIIELLLFTKIGSKGDDYRLVGLEYLKEIRSEKFMLINKLSYLVNKDVDIVSIGDSSGMVSLNPQIIERHLDGMKMFNGNTQQPIGVPGYLNVGRIYLKNNDNIKYLIYHITPYQMKVGHPDRIGWSTYIYEHYLSSYRFISSLPSSSLRVFLTNLLYYFGKDRVKAIDIPHRLVNGNPNGFFALTLNGEKDVKECNFTGWVNKKGEVILAKELEKVKKLSDEYGVKLIVIFGATSCQPGENLKPLIADLEKFKEDNPDVYVPIGLVNHLSADNFGDPVHILPKATESYSNMIGEKIEKFITKQDR